MNSNTSKLVVYPSIYYLSTYICLTRQNVFTCLADTSWAKTWWESHYFQLPWQRV